MQTNSLGAAGWIALAMLLTGCARTPPPNFFLLDFPVDEQLAGIERGLAIGLGPINLPQYLDRPQIVTRESENAVKLSEANQWAEPLKASISRVLVVNIGRRLKTNRVYTVPQRRRTPLDFQVSVDFGRFDGSPGKEVVLAARWSLFGKDGKELLYTGITIIHEPTKTLAYDGLVSAQVRALERLGEEISTALRAQPGA